MAEKEEEPKAEDHIKALAKIWQPKPKKAASSKKREEPPSARP